ncbi:MAG: U32 family peptidase [Polyangiaceae bacterium]|nr:U32 family peptidase [Polyangiaceae bacterium]
MSPKKPEILAPAGDEAALRAALAAGADAVYFGLQAWSARARATNFGDDALAAAIDLLHRHGGKGYVALNTLVFDAELDAVEASIRRCAEAGVDAVIVQDLGVARLVRAIAPGMPLHASTQMTCTDAEAVELAAELGASRVILARELSLEDVAAIRSRTDVEVEVFVHGALCVAYSGQCLTSEAIGGRSANRGACAQACRLPYDLVVDGAVKDTGDRAFLLSPEDLEASELVPKLVELGVASLKIEGRLKGPAYVAATTSLYRAAVDASFGEAPAPSEAQRATALATFTRGSGPGFLAGVDHQRLVDGRTCDHRGELLGVTSGVVREGGKAWLRIAAKRAIEPGHGLLVEGTKGGAGEVGGRVWMVTQARGDEQRVWLGPEKTIPSDLSGRRVFLTDDPSAEKRALAMAERAPARVRLDVRLSARPGEPARLEGTLPDGTTASVTGEDPVERARTAATSESVVRDKLGRLGDSPFELGAVQLELEGEPLVSPGSLNRLRRALVEALLERRARRHPTTQVSAQALLAAAVLAAPPPPPGLLVLCRSLEQARAARAAGADGVWLDLLELTGTGSALRQLRADGPGFVGVAPPRIRKPGEEKIDRFLAGLEPDGVLVRGLGALREATGKVDGVLRVGDFALNATNRLTILEILGRGLAAFTPSFDLDAAQLCDLLRTGVGPYAEVVVHHPMPLFHMEHCVFARELSTGRDHRDCGRPCERHAVSLRDRAGIEHPVIADVGCRNTVFHAQSQSAASLVPAMREAGVRRYRVELVRESAADTEKVVRAYRKLLDGGTSGAEVYRTLKAESTYGVVRGSLRVLA